MRHPNSVLVVAHSPQSVRKKDVNTVTWEHAPGPSRDKFGCEVKGSPKLKQMLSGMRK